MVTDNLRLYKSKLLRVSLVCLIRLIPILMSIAIVGNILLGYLSTIYGESVLLNNIYFIINYIFGNGLLSMLLLILLSLSYNYCLWHRILIYYCLVNITLDMSINLFNIGIDMNNLICIYSIILGIAIIKIVISLWVEKRRFRQ